MVVGTPPDPVFGAPVAKLPLPVAKFTVKAVTGAEPAVTVILERVNPEGAVGNPENVKVSGP
jgi:hypothetical protein